MIRRILCGQNGHQLFSQLIIKKVDAFQYTRNSPLLSSKLMTPTNSQVFLTEQHFFFEYIFLISSCYLEIVEFD